MKGGELMILDLGRGTLNENHGSFYLQQLIKLALNERLGDGT